MPLATLPTFIPTGRRTLPRINANTRPTTEELGPLDKNRIPIDVTEENFAHWLVTYGIRSKSDFIHQVQFPLAPALFLGEIHKTLRVGLLKTFKREKPVQYLLIEENEEISVPPLTSDNIKEIAFMFGYPSVAAFRRESGIWVGSGTSRSTGPSGKELLLEYIDKGNKPVYKFVGKIASPIPTNAAIASHQQSLENLPPDTRNERPPATPQVALQTSGYYTDSTLGMGNIGATNDDFGRLPVTWTEEGREFPRPVELPISDPGYYKLPFADGLYQIDLPPVQSPGSRPGFAAASISLPSFESFSNIGDASRMVRQAPRDP